MVFRPVQFRRPLAQAFESSIRKVVGIFHNGTNRSYPSFEILVRFPASATSTSNLLSTLYNP